MDAQTDKGGQKSAKVALKQPKASQNEVGRGQGVVALREERVGVQHGYGEQRRKGKVLALPRVQQKRNAEQEQ